MISPLVSEHASKNIHQRGLQSLRRPVRPITGRGGERARGRTPGRRISPCLNSPSRTRRQYPRQVNDIADVPASQIRSRPEEILSPARIVTGIALFHMGVFSRILNHHGVTQAFGNRMKGLSMNSWTCEASPERPGVCSFLQFACMTVESKRRKPRLAIRKFFAMSGTAAGDEESPIDGPVTACARKAGLCVNRRCMELH